MDIKKLMREAQNMQNSLTQKIGEFDKKLFDFDYKGLVKLKIYGSLNIVSIEYTDKSLVDSSDIETLQDVTTSAVNNAIDALIKGKNELTQKIAGPDIDLNSLLK